MFQECHLRSCLNTTTKNIRDNWITLLAWMGEREGRKRLIMRIEREIECVVYEMRMSGHGWLLLRRWIDDDLYDRYWWVECVFVFSSTMREREREIEWGLIEKLLKWLSIGIDKWVSDCFLFFFSIRFSFFSFLLEVFFFFFFFFSLSLFLTSTPLHPPTSSFYKESSISLSCCPPPWLWEWLCWWWLLFLEMTHKHFVTLFQIFVHWTRLVSLPHVVGVMTMVLPSPLHTVQQDLALFLS